MRNWLIAIGIAILVLGLLWPRIGRSDLERLPGDIWDLIGRLDLGRLPGTVWNWFGRLPGDIWISKPGFEFFMPLATTLVVSILISILFWIFRK